MREQWYENVPNDYFNILVQIYSKTYFSICLYAKLLKFSIP